MIDNIYINEKNIYLATNSRFNRGNISNNNIYHNIFLFKTFLVCVKVLISNEYCKFNQYAIKINSKRPNFINILKCSKCYEINCIIL